MNQVIANIRAVKLYGWESVFGEKIGQLRDKEIAYLRHLALVKSTIQSFSSFTPGAAAICKTAASEIMATDSHTATFVAYALLGNTLQALTVFTALHLFNELQVPIMVIPRAYGMLIDISIAMGRVQKMLAAEELRHKFVVDPNAESAISVKGSFQYEEAICHLQNQQNSTVDTRLSESVPVRPFALKNISLQIPDGRTNNQLHAFEL